MAAIQVIDLSFQYPDSGEMIFSHVSFTLDTDWKLGFIGRNGKGKTTFLRILMGMEGATGRVVSPCAFDLFPFPVPDEGRPAREVARAHAGPYAELEARMEAALADPDGAQAYAEALGEYLELDGYTLDARLLAETGCDLVMVGRGALGNPWVFRQINAYLTDSCTLIPPPGVAERIMVIKRHIDALCALKGEDRALREARKHVGWYLHGLRGAAQFRRRAGELCTLADLDQLLAHVYAANQGEG